MYILQLCAGFEILCIQLFVLVILVPVKIGSFCFLPWIIFLL